MKKLFTALICAIMVLGMGGCSNQDNKESKKSETIDEKYISTVKSNLEKRWQKQMDNDDYNSIINTADDFKNMKQYFEIEINGLDKYENDKFQSEELGKLSQNYYNSLTNSIKAIDDYGTLNDTMDTYNKEIQIRNASLYTMISKYGLNLDKKYELAIDDITNVGESAIKEKDYQSWKPGTYEVGKDISAGEYLVMHDKVSSNDSVEIRQSKYSDGNTLYGNVNFINDYVILQDGWFIEADGCKLYKTDDMPNDFIKADNTYGSITLKVGTDIKAGDHKITPTEKSNYFEVLTKNYDAEIQYIGEIIQNDADFSVEKYINLEEGQYISLTGCKIE